MRCNLITRKLKDTQEHEVGANNRVPPERLPVYLSNPAFASEEGEVSRGSFCKPSLTSKPQHIFWDEFSTGLRAPSRSIKLILVISKNRGYSFSCTDTCDFDSEFSITLPR